MAMPTLVEQLAQEHLGGPLPPDFIELMRPLDDEREEVRACLRRAFRWMELARFRPSDFSFQLAQFLAKVMPGSIPGAWGGAPPPITMPGRHERLDDYVAQNPYWQPTPGARFIDVGCGFPPVTAMDTAGRFPDMAVLAIDPAFGQYLVYDDVGDHACFDADGAVRFVGSGGLNPARSETLRRNAEATRARFDALRVRLLPLLPDGVDPAEASNAEGRIVRDPMAQFAAPNLSFQEVGIGAAGLPDADIVRCMNVLLYFDAPFYRNARAWAGRLLRSGGLFIHGTDATNAGRAAMYFTWRREAEVLVPLEFAVDPVVLRALLPISWHGFHDDDEEHSLRNAVIGTLWSSDAAFRAAFDTNLDALLAELGFYARRPDGFLSGPPTGASSASIWDAWRTIESRLASEGWIDRAAEVLQRATGKRAWRNCIGHLAVDPTEWGWEPVPLAPPGD